jgi:hypothetical protein
MNLMNEFFKLGGERSTISLNGRRRVLSRDCGFDELLHQIMTFDSIANAFARRSEANRATDRVLRTGCQLGIGAGLEKRDRGSDSDRFSTDGRKKIESSYDWSPCGMSGTLIGDSGRWWRRSLAETTCGIPQGFSLPQAAGEPRKGWTLNICNSNKMYNGQTRILTRHTT